MERTHAKQAQAIQDAFVILRKRRFLTQRLKNMAKTKMTNEKLEEINHIRRQLEASHIPMYTLRLIFKIFKLHAVLKSLQVQKQGLKISDPQLNKAIANTMKKLDSL